MNTITKRDLIEQNIDKVFPDGIDPQPPEMTSLAEIALRPTGITTVELEAAKALAMSGPIIPEFMRGNPGAMLAAMQIAKRFSKYDARTNSWISFDPIAVASCMYLVESSKGTSVGYTSAFIAAVIDGFAPIASRMRFTYDGEGETRRCTASALLKGDTQPFEVTTPELRLITPKKSPLWQSNPDQQLAYYARRNWGRLYAPGVLLGVYDVEELEGEARQHRGPLNAKDVSEGAGALHKRLADHAANNHSETEPAGYHPDAVERGLSETPAQSPREGQGRDPGPESDNPAPGKKKRASEAPAKAAKGAKGKPRALPQNAKHYRQHVEAWLEDYDTEQDIEARWRAEMKLRNACGLVEEDRLPIRTLIDQRIAELRK